MAEQTERRRRRGPFGFICSFEPPDILPRKPVQCGTRTHNRIDLGYVQWHTLADRRRKARVKQIRCETCQRWFWPDELDLPEARVRK